MRATLRRYFWNPKERRLRAPWRLLATALVFLVMLLAFVTLFALTVSEALLAALFGTALADDALLVVGSVGSGAALVFGVLLAARYVDRRRIADLGLALDHDWWVDLGFGFVLGAGLMSGVFLVALAAGWLRVTGTFASAGSFGLATALVVVLFLAVGIYEELLVRGYVLTNLAEGMNGFGPFGHRSATLLAVLWSSLLFGFFHASNPGATLASVLAVSFAGVMLAAGYVFTGQLGLSIGLHTAWNLFQGFVFGLPVSGLSVPGSLVAVEMTGPAVATGGSFGPEAGLLGVLAMLVGTGAVAAYANLQYGQLRASLELTRPDLRWKR